jgi:hypothetical protein
MKQDGRKRADVPVVFKPGRARNGQIQNTIDAFLHKGTSTHSRHHILLAYIIDYCEKNRIDYALFAYPGQGYTIIRQEQDETR